MKIRYRKEHGVLVDAGLHTVSFSYLTGNKNEDESPERRVVDMGVNADKGEVLEVEIPDAQVATVKHLRQMVHGYKLHGRSYPGPVGRWIEIFEDKTAPKA